MTEIIIIAGVAQNGVIGKQGELPWHISEDLRRFRSLTLNHPVIMGRKTYESIIKVLGNPLKDRTSIVVTRNSEYSVPEGVIVCGSVEEALTKAKKLDEKKVFVIGGQEIYEQTIEKADKLELTRVHKNYEGDAFFPKVDEEKWERFLTEDKTTKEGELNFSFVSYQKKENKRNGFFIAFEGIDGSGKSTQIRKLLQHIFEKDKHHHIVLTRNPYQDTEIRKILHEDDDPYAQAEKLAELFITDRRKQTEEIIKPNLEKGHFVLSDRYKLSTVSYQTAQGLKMEDLIDRQKDLPVANVTFIIDVAAEQVVERMKKEDVQIRGKEHKFEANIDFIRKLRENYHRAAEILTSNGEKVYVINGEGTPDEVFLRVKDIFDYEFTHGKVERRKAANLVFYDNNGNVLLQNRKGISKWGEEYHFFGGHIEPGETPEETVKREVKEELGIDLNEAKLFKYWPHYGHGAKCFYETSVFIAPMPFDLSKLNVTDGKAEVVKFEDAFNFKMVEGYNELLREIWEKVRNEANNL